LFLSSEDSISLDVVLVFNTPHFHKYLEGSPFFANKVCDSPPSNYFCSHLFQFIDGLESTRVYIISNVCKNAPVIFPITVTSEVYLATFNQSQIPEIATLLGNPNKPTEAHPRYAPVLYKDRVITEGNLFGSVAILKVSWPPSLGTISESFYRYSRPYSLS